MIDTIKFYLILIDALGNGYSSSPSNSAKQPRLQFPKFTIRDMVESQHKMLTENFNIQHVVAITGISMGGLQSFQWAVSYPDFMDKVIPIVGTPQLTSYDLLWTNITLEAIQNDTAYRKGNYNGNPVLPVASHIGNLLITTPEYVTTHVSRDSFYIWFASTEKSTGFDWNNEVRQLQALISHDISKSTGGSLTKAAETIKAKMLIIISQQDHLMNPIPSKNFATLVSAELIILDDNCGHIANGCESQKLNKAMQDFLLTTN
jgi:homoserine O-acetyltransferase